MKQNTTTKITKRKSIDSSGYIDYKEKVAKVPKSVYIPKGFKLDNSIVPGAGLGVFAEHQLPSNCDLGFYKGKWVTPEEYDKSNKKMLYVWEILDYRGNKNRPKGEKFDRIKPIGYIDGELKKDSNYLRYLNHPPDDAHENVRAYQEKGKIRYVTTRPVMAGEELFVSYGPNYGKMLTGKK